MLANTNPDGFLNNDRTSTKQARDNFIRGVMRRTARQARAAVAAAAGSDNMTDYTSQLILMREKLLKKITTKYTVSITEEVVEKINESIKMEKRNRYERQKQLNESMISAWSESEEDEE